MTLNHALRHGVSLLTRLRTIDLFPHSLPAPSPLPLMPVAQTTMDQSQNALSRIQRLKIAIKYRFSTRSTQGGIEERDFPALGSRCSLFQELWIADDWLHVNSSAWTIVADSCPRV